MYTNNDFGVQSLLYFGTTIIIASFITLKNSYCKIVLNQRQMVFAKIEWFHFHHKQFGGRLLTILYTHELDTFKKRSFTIKLIEHAQSATGTLS